MSARFVLAVVAMIGCHAAMPPPQIAPPLKPIVAPLANAAPTTTGPHAEWVVERTADNRTALRELVWLEDGTHVAWHRRPPGRIARISMCCWDDHEDASVRERFAWLEPVVLDDEIIFQQERQLWVLSRRDGSVVFDWSDNRSTTQRRTGGGIVDTGTVDISIAGQTCSSTLEGQHFARACGHVLVYYDDGLFELFDRQPYQLIEQKIDVGDDDVRDSCRSHDVDTTYVVGPATIRLRGRRIVECVH